MRTLLLLSALWLPVHREAAPASNVGMTTRVSVRADTDSALFVGIISDLTVEMNAVARRHNYDATAGVPGWLEPAYLASASTRPDVAQYFTARAAYTAELATRLDTIAATIVDRRLHAMGYDVMRSRDLRAAFFRGYARSAGRQKMMFGAMRRQATVALKLHEFLVKVDAHVAVDAKDSTLVNFDRPADRARYLELATAMDIANQQLDQLIEQSEKLAAGKP